MSQQPGTGAQAGDPTDAVVQESDIVEVLRTVYDPEIPVNIYELGLVYGIVADSSGRVDVQMTLTSPGCPVADSLVREIEGKLRAVAGVREAHVELVWEPPWEPSRMSEAAALELGFM